MWDLSEPLFVWPGVTVAVIGADAGRVVNLTVSRKGLTGAVPAEIAQLTAMFALDLSKNGLTSVPAELAGLPALTSLDLSGNRLTSVVGDTLRAHSIWRRWCA